MKEQKEGIIRDYAVHQTDTGSPEVQIALMTGRIAYLTEHFKTHKKDFHSRHGLLRIVGQRRKMIEYLKKKDLERYQKVIERLGLRK